ncbi:Protein of unknown function [Geoalkalibacter ferrihydriticus]|uniref:Putative Se/S carrier protein-like domain-containing protein n=2 Tax=Geoalkalibacter ferrihydriticus TaxID=392333 RepID=A0A0C2EHX0_9BACT|nr:DUF3343 domain-containing protein [Geoalkalibacter ferrihydriticus]KIH78243.1 hypothetical protein GFER_04765 [Geoalkalibacter ferrihydriticus DSM 17813]SDM36794.1 Protein of unknown function [Geoalkalibacter ferrihydriticus]
MVRDNDIVAIFHGIHRVMKAEKILKEAGAEILLIPTPRELSSDCGLAIRFVPAERERVLKVLAEADLNPVELYRRSGRDYELLLSSAGNPG